MTQKVFIFFLSLVSVLTLQFLPSISLSAESAKAIFGAGCFWCIEKDFEKYEKEGVSSVISGYTGGPKANPTYEQVSAGDSGHIEVVEVTYDPKKITYIQLLKIFWANIDPYDSKGQFCDKGQQYTSAAYYSNDQEKKQFEAFKDQLIKSGKLKGEVFVALQPTGKFYTAEDYHQDYYKKNPIKYKYYRTSCGRDKRLEAIWGKPKK